MNDDAMVDLMIHDGLWEIFNNYHMASLPKTWPNNTGSPVSSRTSSAS